MKELKIQNEDVGSSIMEIITAGLYANNLNCLREYVQNSIDAEASNINVKICNGGRTIVLADDGIGMDEESFRYALKVAFSSKKEEHVGWRGIGIWSGVAICERVVIASKMKGKPKYQVSINSRPLVDPDRRQDRTAVDALNESIEDWGEIPAEGEEEKSYTVVTLSNVHPSLAKMFSRDSIIAYLGRTVPLRFHDDFKPGKEIVAKLEEYGIPRPKTAIFVDREEIFKAPLNSEDVFETPFFKEFRKNDDKDQDILAVGWFVNTNSNAKLKDPSVTYRKKNFRIGETSLVDFNSSVKFRGWQHGEIHILNGAIVENASRDGFNVAIPEANDLFETVGEFMVSGLEALAHYTSQSLATTTLNKARDALGKNDKKTFFNQLENAERKGSSERNVPPELFSIKKSIDEKAREEINEIKRLKNEAAGEEERSEPIKELAKAAGAKERLKIKSKSFHPVVKKHYIKRTAAGKAELNLLMCDPLMEILKKKTGITDDSLATISKKAFDWDHISSSKSEEKAKNRPYVPVLSVVGDPLEDSNDTRRNKEFGVFLAFLWDFFNTADRHGELEKMPWYSGMTPSEKAEWIDAVWTMVDIAAKIIDRAEKVDLKK